MRPSDEAIESRLYAHARSFSEHQPTPELTVRIMAGAEHQPRGSRPQRSFKRDLFLAAITATFLVGLGVVFGTFRHLAQPANGSTMTVSWVDRPISTYEPPASTPLPYPTSASPCKASQLRAGPGLPNGGAGHAVLQVGFDNVGTVSCLLGGRPKVTGVVPSGIRVALPIKSGSTFIGPLLPADIAPGARGYLNLGNVSTCDSPATSMSYRNLSFEMPGGGVLNTDTVFNAGPCGIVMDNLGLPPRPAPMPTPGPLAGLDVRLSLPDSVQAGSVLRYVVIVTNRTGNAVQLSPCPGYTEQLASFPPEGDMRVTQASYALNCDAVTTIGAHTQVRYSMELQIPLDVSPGRGRLSWTLNESGGPLTTGAINIEPNT